MGNNLIESVLIGAFIGAMLGALFSFTRSKLRNRRNQVTLSSDPSIGSDSSQASNVLAKQVDERTAGLLQTLPPLNGKTKQEVKIEIVNGKKKYFVNGQTYNSKEDIPAEYMNCLRLIEKQLEESHLRN